MKFTILGDIHCNIEHLKNVCSASKHPILQLGDFDVTGYGKAAEIAAHSPVPIYFIDGNHDYFPALNPNSEKIVELSKNLFYIPRGFISGTVLFFGGADSVDKKAIDWYPEEQISYGQILKVLNYNGSLSQVIAHTCPDFATPKQFYGKTSAEKLLSEIANTFHVDQWFFGHWHIATTYIKKGIWFTCVDINQHFIVDLDVNKNDWKH